MTRTPFAILAAALLTGLAVTIGCQRSAEPPEDRVEEADEGPAEPLAPASAEDREALAEGGNRFAVALYRKVAAEAKGDVFLSPYSISAALAMTCAGARTETAAQMAKVLGIDGLGERVHPAHADLAWRLKGDGKEGRPEFRVANSLWGQKGLPFEGDFLKLTKTHYGAGLREVDFIDDREAARATINQWVAGRTRDKIPELLRMEDLAENTRLVLTNAIYFKGLWRNPFTKANTKPEPFWASAEKSADVPTMRRSVEAMFHEGDGFKAVALPYGRGPVGMILVVPDARDGLAVVERKLTAEAVRGWFAHQPASEVDLRMPVFKSKGRFQLADTLKGMGMERPFSNDADFSGMVSPSEVKLKISKVIHEAVIEVNEEGTEAAAATAVLMGAITVSEPRRPPRRVELRADRPFLHLIVDHTDGTILFLGRYTGP